MVDTFIIGDSTNIIFELYDCDLAKYMVDNRREMCDRLKVRDFFKQVRDYFLIVVIVVIVLLLLFLDNDSRRYSSCKQHYPPRSETPEHSC